MPADPSDVELAVRIPAAMKEHLDFIAARIDEPLDAVVAKALESYLYGKGIYFNALTAFASEEAAKPSPATGAAE